MTIHLLLTGLVLLVAAVPAGKAWTGSRVVASRLLGLVLLVLGVAALVGVFWF